MIPPFHMAFPVRDIEETRRFYCDVLGCKQGRMTDHWIDIDFFGHQLSAHLRENVGKESHTSEVDGISVPLRHFGAVLPWGEMDKLAERVKQAGVKFVIEPRLRYEGKVGEQKTMFFLDPSGNAMEFKAFKNPAELFAV
ncbi:MAG: VOC family protein [Alphaproteobacteria bacterium]|nr:VOC family protein [Alphaproteobacteria bacterium]